MKDFLFRDATVIDGTGGPAIVADVKIADGFIAEVGAVASARDAEVVDAMGMTIAPGFIDVHSHDDFAALVHPDMAFKTAGGVTTCIVGNCGCGVSPRAEALAFASVMHPQPMPDWNGYRGYFDLLETTAAAVNIATLVGLGPVRSAVMGEAPEPTAAQLRDMKALIDEGLDAGAVGISSGLMYDPGRHAGTDELVELAATLHDSQRIYATHMRDEGPGLLRSVAEAIEIGERARVPVQISHHKAAGKEAWGLVERSLAIIDAARQRGVDVHSDQYPYTAGSTMLAAVFRDGEFGGSGIGRIEPEDVVVASAPGNRNWEGKSVQALADAMGVDPADAARRVLEDEPGAMVVMHMMDEADVRRVMRHPATMIGSDGVPTLEGTPHPRLYGSFARVLGRYARDEGVLPLTEAVHRMTGLSARKFGLSDRGALKPGYRADIVMFDAAAIRDNGTFDAPHQPPSGIDAVLVNGVPAVWQGRSTAARAGQVLRWC